LKRLLLLFVLFLPGCGPMANRIWPPWGDTPKNCHTKKCDKGECCVMRGDGPHCEPEGKACK
jgi:hypothetical protein